MLTAAEPPSIDLEVWYRLYSEAIYRFILHRVRTPEDAEDLLQSTYLGACEKSAAYRGTAQPTTWLIAIAVDLLRHDSLRAADARCIVEPLSGDGGALLDMRFPERTVEVRQSFLVFLEFAQSLSAEQQRMLELIFIDNVSYVQAAAMLGVPVGTVRSRLSRLRAKLEKHCERPD
jgi:RNA polymerase sigma-70 factor (ECF subfamily)